MREQATITARQVPRGFTALEVVLALAVTGLIAICVVSLVGASSSVLLHEADVSPGVASGDRARSYLERTLRISHDVGYWASGAAADPPALLLWAHDLRSRQGFEVHDHQIQACELVVVWFDSATHKVRLYLPVEWTSMTVAEQTEAGEVIAAASFAAKTTADAFMGRSWVETHVLAGTAPGEQVTAMWVDVDRTGENPVVRFGFNLAREGKIETINGAVRLRVPSQDDNWTTLILQEAPET